MSQESECTGFDAQIAPPADSACAAVAAPSDSAQAEIATTISTASDLKAEVAEFSFRGGDQQPSDYEHASTADYGLEWWPAYLCEFSPS